MSEYQSRFERLSNQARDWLERQLLGTFIEGLIPEIRCEVKARQPRTMMAAISFARLHEEKIGVEYRRNKGANKQVISRQPTSSTPSQNHNTSRLTREELKERLAKGLCWHCDEKWSKEH